MKRQRIQVFCAVLVLMAAAAGAGYAASVTVGIHIPELPQPPSTCMQPAPFPAWERPDPVAKDACFEAHWDAEELEPQLVWTVEGSVEELLVEIRACREQDWQPVTSSSAIVAAGEKGKDPVWEIRRAKAAAGEGVLPGPIILTLAAL